MAFRWTALAVLAGGMASAQTGSLRIVAKDASGAAIASAAGTAEHLATGAVERFTTAVDGSAALGPRVSGRYRIVIRKDGFAEWSGAAMVRDTETVVAATLEVGAASTTVAVTASTPLPGSERSADEIPAPVQTLSAADFASTRAVDLSSLMNQRINGVYLNEIQGNPMQADLNYRGYTASPLLGTPQGISIYLDGVRINQAFGDVVNWDLIPRDAIAEAALIPGANPLFGLNTLGGALSLRTKDGYSAPGTSVELGGGSFGRKTAALEHGGAARNGFNWFLTSNLFFEDGWRESSPSNVRQGLGRIGWSRGRTSLGLTATYANNALIGNALQERTLLDRDWRSVFTKPDVTANRSPFVILNARHAVTSAWSVSANAYFRHIRTITLNGDLNDDSLDQSLYQPSAGERNALTAAGYRGFPTAGESAANTPFPFWRCIGNALLRDEPAEKCNGLINRSRLHQRSYGVSGQASFTGRAHQFTAGAAYDGSNSRFAQSSELGYLNPDRSITGVAAFGDGVTGGDADGEPFDTRVDLSGRIHTAGLYATDTVRLGHAWNATLSGRFQHASVHNLDHIRPVAGRGSLTGDHVFRRFNPAAGLTYRAAESASLYFSYSEGSRAPTAIELGCADPESPCRLPHAAGDPPLKQVVSRTIEGGARGSSGATRWSAGWYWGANRDDILFVAARQSGYGYFKNFGETRRRGLEADLRHRWGRLGMGLGYTFLHATFESPEEVNGGSNSANDEARRGRRGFEGSIDVEPGARIPLTPRHMYKAFGDVQITRRLQADVSYMAVSGSLARGNENGEHLPDGRYYLGAGESGGYGVVHLAARYRVHARAELFGQVNNLFDARYTTAAQLAPNPFTAAGTFVARPFPAVSGEFPLRHSTLFAPGAPRGAWAGVRVRF